MEHKNVRLVIFLFIIFTITILSCQANALGVFYYDKIIKICEKKNPNKKGINVITFEPDEKSHYKGIYKLEFCALSNKHDNDEYLVKLVNVQTEEIYKTAIAGDAIEINPFWNIGYVVTNVGDRAVCFKLSKEDNNLPQKQPATIRKSAVVDSYNLNKNIYKDCL